MKILFGLLRCLKWNCPPAVIYIDDTFGSSLLDDLATEKEREVLVYRFEKKIKVKKDPADITIREV